MKLTFEDYNAICSDCTVHDTCHKDLEINWDKLLKCKKEIKFIEEQLVSVKQPTKKPKEHVVFT